MAEEQRPVAMEHYDRGRASTLQIDVAEAAFLDDYADARRDWQHRLGRPGPLPDPTWMELAARQRRRLAVAESAGSAKESVKTVKAAK